MGANRVRSRARTVPGADVVYTRTRSVPGADAVRSRARSVPGAHAVRSRARSVPGAHGIRSQNSRSGFSVFLFTATEYVLFLPVGLLFIKKNLLTCIRTQISIFPRASMLRRDSVCVCGSPYLIQSLFYSNKNDGFHFILSGLNYCVFTLKLILW